MAANPPETPCVACGTRLPAGAKFCDECGTGQPPPKKIGSQTVIGIASPVANVASIPERPRAPQPTFEPPAEKKNPLGQTMVGLASLPGADRANVPAPQQLAPPVVANNLPNNIAKNIPKGTLMGVALPGIAPSYDPKPPQQPYHAPPPAYQPPPPVPPRVSDPITSSDRTLPDGVPRPSRLPAIVLGLIALASLIAAVLYFVLRPSGPPALTSAIEGDTNAPKLVVKCATCADGSSIDLGGKSATFASGSATIALTPKDLKAGRNVFRGKVVPKGKSPQDVELDVAIPYLVHPSLAPLAEGESRIDVVFELAEDQKAVLVDGHKISGKTHSVEIPAPTEEARIFDKTVHYEVQPKSGTPVIKGSLKVSIPYASLRVGLPGRRPFAIGEELEVSGHTSAGGSVDIGETTLTADDTGLFKGKVKIGKDEKELRLRAYSSKLAPRDIALPVTHAKDAGEVVSILRAEAKTPFAKIAEKPEDHVGAVVSVKFEVAQTKEEDGRAIGVGDTKCAGTKCPVVRVLMPPGATATKGEVFEVLGVVTRALPVEQGKETAVEIDASILIRTK